MISEGRAGQHYKATPSASCLVDMLSLVSSLFSSSCRE
jgi:hypothetical protein